MLKVSQFGELDGKVIRQYTLDNGFMEVEVGMCPFKACVSKKTGSKGVYTLDWIHPKVSIEEKTHSFSNERRKVTKMETKMDQVGNKDCNNQRQKLLE